MADIERSRQAAPYSATGQILRRNLRACIVHPLDDDSAMLASNLQRMGMKVQTVWPAPVNPPEEAELVFLSWRAEMADSEHVRDWSSRIPIIAVISFENPTVIEHALSLGCTSIVMVPVRPSGLLSAVVMGVHLHKQQRQLIERQKRLEQKLTGMRQIAEAKAILMRMNGLDENQAYEVLRTKAMAKRVPIEEICGAVIQANDVFSVLVPRSPGEE